MSKIADLEDHVRERFGVTHRILMQSERDYLVRQLSGPRCADSVTESFAIESFNARVRRLEAAKDGVLPLEGREIRPLRMLPTARIDLYWQTPDAQRLQRDYMRLRGSGNTPVPLTTRQTKDWQDRANRFVVDLEQWTGAREATPRDYFYQKAMLFTDAIDLIPPGAARSRAIRSCVDFLRHADVDRERRTLWFAFAARLIELSRGPDRDLILGVLESTTHPILSLYAKLERTLPEQRRTD